MMPICAVVVPVGPTCKENFVNDTLDSVEFYCPNRSVYIVDDSGTGMGSKVALGRRATVINVSGMGLAGGLYGSLSAGFAEALKNPFDILLRLDTDALVANDRFLTQSSEYFQAHPEIGALGSYRFGYSGSIRSYSQPRKRLLWEMSAGVAKSPRLAAHLASLTAKAIKNGYKLGESIMGGVTVYSHRAVAALAAAGALDDKLVVSSALQEDHIFALWLKSLGLGLADFGRHDNDLPFAAKHKGLPDSPVSIIGREKSLVHSTKYFEDLDESEIRAIFAAERQRHGEL
jgi:hypothetical protein